MSIIAPITKDESGNLSIEISDEIRDYFMIPYNELLNSIKDKNKMLEQQLEQYKTVAANAVIDNNKIREEFEEFKSRIVSIG